MATENSQGRRGLWDGSRADDYDTKWKTMAANGENPHGEADFVQRFDPSSVLDAGCGTGRVGIELARRGLAVAGTDINALMLAQAQAKAPEIQWTESDLAELRLGRMFDAVVMAGNVILFVDPGTESDCVAGAARHVAVGGYLIAGFLIDRHVSAAVWEGWLRAAGLDPVVRYSTWAADAFTEHSNYLVSVARQPTGAERA